jgi:hypothetical protein
MAHVQRELDPELGREPDKVLRLRAVAALCPEVGVRFGVDVGYRSRGGFEFPMGTAILKDG